MGIVKEVWNFCNETYKWNLPAIPEIPDDCYIDCRNQDPEKIYQHIRVMSHETIVGYRKAALEFLGSSLADRFTRKYWAQAIVERLKVQDEKTACKRNYPCL